MSRGFQFKQFFIAHDQCAMKVGTDAILLGSWVQVGAANRLLDIGTGSGILAIMLAQKAQVDAHITALEISPAAAKQAGDNVAACPWAERIKVYQQAIQHYKAEADYDLIVSNPPYFVTETAKATGLASEPSNKQRAQARLTFDLNYATLLKAVSQMLSARGQFYTILPTQGAEAFCQLASQFGLFCTKKMQARSFTDKPIIRQLMRFEWQQKACETEYLTIYQADNLYTDNYRQLCRDYYLNF